MKIEKGRVVELDYSLHFGDGKVVDRSEPGEPLTYLHGEGEIVPGLESALEGLTQGDARQVVVAPAEGYGERDPESVQHVPRTAFPPGFEPTVGMELVAQDDGGDDVPFTIRSVAPDEVTIDLNHPLAGETLHFDVKVLSVRDATAEELEHGHVHGADGHGDHGHEP